MEDKIAQCWEMMLSIEFVKNSCVQVSFFNFLFSSLWNFFKLRICINLVDGNYGNWTKLFECSVTCGVGYELWQRKCDSPPPKHGGDCFKYGKDRESRVCRRKPCLGELLGCSLNFFARA